MSMIKKLLEIAARIGALQAKTVRHSTVRAKSDGYGGKFKTAGGMTARDSIYTFG